MVLHSQVRIYFTHLNSVKYSLLIEKLAICFIRAYGTEQAVQTLPLFRASQGSGRLCATVTHEVGAIFNTTKGHR